MVLGIREGELTDVLRNEPPLTDAETSKRIVYDTDTDGMTVRDDPVSFSQLHRQYGFRMKKEETLFGAEHDPMAEL